VTQKGFSHIGLSVLDLERTRAFCEGVFGFKPAAAPQMRRYGCNAISDP
jgi:catechol 2,3-dioxygenase-like lactoylglutathione lyase family enzyme